MTLETHSQIQTGQPLLAQVHHRTGKHILGHQYLLRGRGVHNGS
jgi:hypothetical protein